MKAKIRKQIDRNKKRIERRLDKNDVRGCEEPMMSASNIHYEISDRTKATAAGGVGALHLMIGQLGLAEEIDRRLHLLKLHLPYHESDHVLNIAYGFSTKCGCLEHLEIVRQDEAYLDALGARRIPDPTTAGDFCRRFAADDVVELMEIVNDTRLKIWRRQEESFFAEAVIDADGTMATTAGQCKQGMDINYKGEWGYQPLVISLANTGEPLYIVNRSGNRPSHEHAAEYLDRAAALCERAGFKSIVFRGDTDFSQTKHLDRWDDAGRQFVFGLDATEARYELADNLPENAWKRLRRPPKYEVKTSPRARPENVKEQIVRQREFENVRLQREHVAEFRYQPTACDREYRVVVVWKSLLITKGQLPLFDDGKAFFYITNDWKSSAEQIVFKANDRCDQENLIQQLKTGVRALQAPVDNLVSNWAYMVMASLAWSLKAWMALLLPTKGPHHERHAEEKRRLLRMDFATFRNAMILIPAQIIRTGRRIVYRLLGWNRWQSVFFRFLDVVRQPLRC